MNPNVLLSPHYRTSYVPDRKADLLTFRWNFTQAYALCLALVGILGTYYVWILNANATKGYNIRTVEVEQRNLALDRNLLSVTLAEYESLDRLSQVGTRKMEPVEAPEYLVVKDQDVAMLKTAAPAAQ